MLVRRALGPESSDAEVAQGLEFFHTYYHQHLLDHTHLYPDVREGLDCLRESGRVSMAVLTNKPIRSTLAIVEGLGLRDHFFRLYGGNSFEQKKPDPVGILALLSESATAREHALMVGDSYVDIRAARNAGVRACGVSWGFQPDTFAADPPDLLVHHMQTLTDYVLSKMGKMGD